MEKLYTVLLVDDEDEFRGRIQANISEKLGFKVIGTAANGYDALEEIEKQAPDILITDIQMPFIDGIELTRILKNTYPTIKVVFISSYDEFQYAKEAIDLDVLSYLNKPISKDSLEEFLIDLKKKLDLEARQIEDIENLKIQVVESRNFVIKNIIKTAFLQKYASAKELEIFEKHNFNPKNYVVINIDGYNQENKELIRKFIADSFRDFEFYSSTIIDSVAYFVVINDEIEFKDLANLCYQALKKYEKLYDNKLYFGISDISNNLQDLIEMHEQASLASRTVNIVDLGNIIYYYEIKGNNLKTLTLTNNQISIITHAINTHDIKQIEELALKVIEEARINKVTDYRYIQTTLLSILINYAASLSIDIGDIDAKYFENFYQQADLKVVFYYFINLIEKIKNISLNVKISRSQKTIDECIDYINKNYENPNLNMDILCEKYLVSVSYLSMLFKKHTETTFVKYLTKVRIEKAKELLKQTDLKISEISLSCGYNEVYYFSHSFKRYVGMSPKEYRG